MKMKLRCIFLGHQWVERKPHRMFDLNDYDCRRCGAHKLQGIYK